MTPLGFRRPFLADRASGRQSGRTLSSAIRAIMDREQATALRDPASTVDEVLDRLRRSRVPRAAATLRATSRESIPISATGSGMLAESCERSRVGIARRGGMATLEAGEQVLIRSGAEVRGRRPRSFIKISTCPV